jgi:uncharacterized cupin superfamily protein
MAEKIKITKPSKDEIKEMNVNSWPIWEKEPSVFPWEYDETEVCYILEGEAVVKTEEGEEVKLV